MDEEDDEEDDERYIETRAKQGDATAACRKERSTCSTKKRAEWPEGRKITRREDAVLLLRHCETTFLKLYFY